ncbi:S-adenosyl-L-methionine-dependent methyltransferase [Vigna unguiculata]|uniref:S-adenosyl-L-methionine-dependent methyltransferase n=1 Tax=Vigna unguiculata TaxID=3917 RepID=A0A4D6MRI6_VIGUN|nr:S-adenosyl-L-methionine-dependent methyltransferase [Vigna unguiculata]
MEWSSKSASMAYLDTLQLCENQKRKDGNWRVEKNPGNNELISALAAGMKAKVIVEVTSCVSLYTIALAVAARQSGGRLVCIIPKSLLHESKQVIINSGLEQQVEFRTEDPSKLLSLYDNIDFFVVDCRDENYTRLLKLVDVSMKRSVIVVAKHVVCDKKGLRWHIRGKDGMEVSRICMNDGSDKRSGVREDYVKKRRKSSWIAKFDEESGEEHIYRVPQLDCFWS